MYILQKVSNKLTKIAQMYQKWQKHIHNWYKISKMYEKLPKFMNNSKIAAVPLKFAMDSVCAVRVMGQ